MSYTLDQMEEFIIVHLDMDSFYASVEIRNNPNLAGLPVVIGADPMLGKGRGVVSTCSYEARAYGLHSGMPISRAYQLCPQAVFIPPSMDIYAQVSARIMSIVQNIAGEIEQVSIDEAYLDLTSCVTYEQAAHVATTIKQAIRQQEGLTCSVGIAPSRIYAKMASELHKPDGMTIVSPTDLLPFLIHLPAGAIPGIGKKSELALTDAGIYTIGDIATTNIQVLQDIFGSHAVRLYQIAQGLDREGLRNSGKRKSISREHTFLEDTSDPDTILCSMQTMIYSLQGELEERNIYSRTIGIRIRYPGFITRTKSVTFMQPTRDIRIIEKAVYGLFTDMWDTKPVRLIGVRCFGLVYPDPVQRTLFDFKQNEIS
ncbi:DNA polymerase IV [anaerobic digester metagenome]